MLSNLKFKSYILTIPKLTHEQKREYITFRNRYAYISYLNDEEGMDIFTHKYKSYKLFEKEYDRDIVFVQNIADYDTVKEFVNKHRTFFVKPDSLALGIGVHRDCIDNYANLDEFMAHLLSLAKKYSKVSWAKGAGLVLEEEIMQDESMALMHPKSVNMIRLTTALVGGEPQFVDAWFRVGIKGNDITAGFIGEICCGVNMDTGIVETNGFTEFCDRFEKHPDTGISFIGYRIPRWDDMKELAIRLSHKLPSVGYVGWDLTLTKNGWVIIEGNERGEFLGQLVYEKPYRAWFEDMIHCKTNWDVAWWEV